MNADFFSIKYILVLNDEDSETFSPFCGFALNLMEAGKTIHKIIMQPINVLELEMPSTQRTLHRFGSAAGHEIIPVNYSAFRQFQNSNFPNIPFVAVVYDKIKQPDIVSIIKKCDIKPILLDINEDWSLNKYKPLIDLYHKIQSTNSSILPEKYNEINIDKSVETNIVINEDVEIHGLVAPIFNILENMGISFENKKTVLGYRTNQEYQNLILKANGILKNVIEITSKWIHKKYHPYFDAVYVSPPLYAKYSLEQYFEGFQPKNLRNALRNLIAQRDYFVIQQFDETVTEIEQKAMSEAMLFACSLRRQEMVFYWYCLELVFERYLTNFYRIAQGVQTDVNQEMQALLTSTQKKRGISFRKLQTKINKYVCESFRKQLPENKIPAIKIYSDAPIEFATDIKNNLPFLISTKMCKVPVTPGNAFFGYLSNGADIFVSYEELSKILVLRSFKDDDPIKLELENTIKSYQSKEKFSIDIQFIDVSNIDELLQARQKYADYKIVIFDCHGSHSKNKIYGNLIIGEELFNIWEYRFQFVPPLIALFSACETYPLGNNFNSVATGFLASGAKTAIATNMPVSSFDSAVFISRILLRFDMLLPELIHEAKIESVTWLDFISDFFRMSYKSDVIRYFRKHNLLNCNESELIHFSSMANMDINYENPEWFNNLLNVLSKYSRKSIEDCRAIINRDVGFTETMKYIVLGDADSINIHS